MLPRSLHLPTGIILLQLVDQPRLTVATSLAFYDTLNAAILECLTFYMYCLFESVLSLCVLLFLWLSKLVLTTVQAFSKI